MSCRNCPDKEHCFERRSCQFNARNSFLFDGWAMSVLAVLVILACYYLGA
jgi:hypothetical protein